MRSINKMIEKNDMKDKILNQKDNKMNYINMNCK